MILTANQLFKFLFKKAFVVLLFFTLTPITLIASIISLMSIDKTDKPLETNLINQKEIIPAQRALVYSAAENKNSPSISSEIISADARPQIILEYMQKRNSPLAPFAEKIVESADKYGLDYRLIPAIAQKESGLCRVIPPDSHNCWGWGIHSKGTLMFDSYDEAIETVSKGLREKYLDEGYVTPDQIMKKYAHPDSTTWAEGVNMYMDQME